MIEDPGGKVGVPPDVLQTDSGLGQNSESEGPDTMVNFNRSGSSCIGSLWVGQVTHK